MTTNDQLIPIGFPGVELWIRRDDLLHPFIPGNKFRKLKYNLIQARIEKQTRILTFGGAFSNHIAAVAFAGKENNLQTVGVIRGEELSAKINSNPTLTFAAACGMRLEFITRNNYKRKSEPEFIENLKEKFGDFMLIPEGGTNELAVKGCEEILSEDDSKFDFICCPVGTGGTISGLINNSMPHQKILGFPALKGEYLKEEICRFAAKANWDLITDYHFGGYAKVNDKLITFLNDFLKKTGIPLDPIYTGKMIFGVIDLIHKNYFAQGSKILSIHTGGIQGIDGMNIELQNKKSLLIDTND